MLKAWLYHFHSELQLSRLRNVEMRWSKMVRWLERIPKAESNLLNPFLTKFKF